MSNLLFPVTEDGTPLSKEMAVPRLMKGQTARYKLIASDEYDPFRTDESGRIQLKKTPGYSMCGKKVIYDPIAGRSVTIVNPGEVKIEKTRTGDIRTQRPKSVKFLSDKPMIEVRDDQPELYAFLERTSENRDNPFRSRKVKPLYYRIDARKKLAQDLEKDGFEVEATQWVYSKASFADLRACAEYVNKHVPGKALRVDWKLEETEIGYQTLKKELFAVAKTYPHVIVRGSTLTGAQMRMQVMDAEKMQIIMFSTSKDVSKANTWFHNDLNLTNICTIEIGTNKHDGLLEFLAKDKEGPKHYQKIIESLKKVLSPD